MTNNVSLTQALSFINCQLRSPGAQLGRQVRPAVTLSRMTGSGGHNIAAQLATQLQNRVPSPTECPWTVFDRNLVAKVLEDHDLPTRVAEFMPENHRSMLEDTLEEFLGLHPSSWTLFQQTSETIWQLAQMGYVVLVGRGANLITSRLPHVFHVRLVGSEEPRVNRIRRAFDLSSADALELIRREDQGRRRFIREHFGKDIDDPLIYHLVLNTDQLSEEDAAGIIAGAMTRRFHLITAPAQQADSWAEWAHP